MNKWLIFATGLLARLVAVVAEFYSDWLLNKLASGGEALWDFYDDVRDFADWLIEVVAGRCCGRPDYQMY